MDLYSRRIVSYGVSYKGEDVNVQIEVLKNAIIQRNPLYTLTVHSDNGNSFKDEFYRKIINTNLNLSQTFNRVEFACGDNSHMESFFATLNKEFYRPSFIKVNPKDSLYKYITPR